jgi:hypothetical protein
MVSDQSFLALANSPLGVNLSGAGGQDNTWRGSRGGGGFPGCVPLGGDAIHPRAMQTSGSGGLQSLRSDSGVLISHPRG